MDDFRKLIYGVLVAFVGVLVVWVSIVYISACGFSFTCHRGQPVVDSTPIPTLAAATLPAPGLFRAKSHDQPLSYGCGESDRRMGFFRLSRDGCIHLHRHRWSESVKEPSERCAAAVLESNVWYPGALSCASCHNADLAISSAQMDMTTYAGLLAGSRRTSPRR
jgi:hypothetical protein